MKKLMQDIAEWHKETFDTTREAQLIKLAEEVNEAHNSSNRDDWFKEMADVFFVLAALVYRYKDMTANVLLHTLWTVNDNESQKRIYDELSKKFEKNKKRIWVKQPDGTYHHAPGTD